MASQTLLIVITLAATIVGTIFEMKLWVKICLIALAAASSIMAIFKSYEDYQDTQFIKGALAAELASSKPLPAFRRAFDESLNRVAHSKGLRLNEAVEKDRGILYFYMTQYTDVPAGASSFSLDTLGDAYVKYVSKMSMDNVLSNAMFRVPDLKNQNEKEDIEQELGFVGNIAIDKNVPWITQETSVAVNTNYDPDEVSVEAEQGVSKIKITLDNDFLASILNLPPYARDWRAYQEFERQIHMQINKPNESDH
jgi:hypothetical protein